MLSETFYKHGKDEETSFVNKYRPKSLDEVVGQEKVVNAIRRMIRNGHIPHLLFSGKPGTGKTSVAQCIARELWGNEWKTHIEELNASDERGIDIVRNKIKRWTRTVGERIIFLDEADRLTDEAQHALRRIMENSNNTIFILSCNEPHKIIDPIKSRCVEFTFNPIKDDEVLRKLISVCNEEGISFDPNNRNIRDGFFEIVRQSKGDLRKALNILEKLVGENKEILPENVEALKKAKVAGEALKMALSGNFEEAKNLLEDGYINSDYDVNHVIYELYDAICEIENLEVKTKLFVKLAEVEHRCKVGSNPLIQLIGFLATAWVIPHLSGCPLIKP